jgi:diguanylate cyclase
MKALITLIEGSQSFLIRRILHYASIHDYTRYTSTLEEAWIMSVSGLSNALIAAMCKDERVPEIEVEHDFAVGEISAFGILEAQKHRHRGVSIEMFLSLMKYYRQTYLDLVAESVDSIDLVLKYQLWINRFFDHNEIAYIHEWKEISDETLIAEMQMNNIRMTNEKNKYLTIFESIPNPAMLIDTEQRCVNMNYAAQRLFGEEAIASGFAYYSDQYQPTVRELLPWVYPEYAEFLREDRNETSVEKEFQSPTQGIRHLSVKFHRMLDVSNKFEGAVILVNDLTEYKKIENQLRYIGFHDNLTGLHNRSFLDEELLRLSSGKFDPVGFLSIDVDGLKQVNDNLGHIVGDSLLRNVGQILKCNFSEDDIVVRMGGDEFAVVMPCCDVEAMEQACGRIRSHIARYNATHTDLPLSISIGGSVGNLHAPNNSHHIMKEADMQMYVDKRKNHDAYVETFMDWLANIGKHAAGPLAV